MYKKNNQAFAVKNYAKITNSDYLPYEYMCLDTLLF